MGRALSILRCRYLHELRYCTLLQLPPGKDAMAAQKVFPPKTMVDASIAERLHYRSTPNMEISRPIHSIARNNTTKQSMQHSAGTTRARWLAGQRSSPPPIYPSTRPHSVLPRVANILHRAEASNARLNDYGPVLRTLRPGPSIPWRLRRRCPPPPSKRSLTSPSQPSGSYSALLGGRKMRGSGWGRK